MATYIGEDATTAIMKLMRDNGEADGLVATRVVEYRDLNGCVGFGVVFRGDPIRLFMSARTRTSSVLASSGRERKVGGVMPWDDELKQLAHSVRATFGDGAVEDAIERGLTAMRKAQPVDRNA